MKNLTKLSVLAASLMLAGNALANDPVSSGAGSVEVSGHVALVCTLSTAGEIDLGYDPQSDVNVGGGTVDFQCNNKKGANITVTSANCGLASSENTEHTIDYDFWLELAGTEYPAMAVGGPFNVAANTIEGVLTGDCNDNSISSLMTAEKDHNLAMENMVTGAISVKLTEDIKFAGWYSDTLTVEISAKL